MNDGELVAVAKTWIQRDDLFKVDFDEIWPMAGYTDRSNARRAFEACIRNFNLAEGLEYSSFKKSIQGPGQPAMSWRMTIGAAKRFLASAQTKEGYAIIEALIRAEEELQAIKANPAALFAEALNPIVGAIESIAKGMNVMSETISDISRRLEAVERNQGLLKIEVRKPLRLMMGRNKQTAQAMADYIAAYGMDKFGVMVANAYRQHYGRDPHKWGLTKNSEWAYSDQEFTTISDNLMERLRDAVVRMHKKSKRIAQSKKPIEGQGELGFQG